ncbi:hypothetical protein [Alkalibacterium sp. 20]|uniref:hypothetical protein n=1 Tax=Alkalibacterium sp. 20 TaxID=1798803 RepID=UPI000B199CEE|nr:hypothetical protein [Alkalibacterium sp. 20]
MVSAYIVSFAADKLVSLGPYIKDLVTDEMIDNLKVYEDLRQEYTGVYNDLFLEFKILK